MGEGRAGASTGKGCTCWRREKKRREKEENDWGKGEGRVGDDRLIEGSVRLRFPVDFENKQLAAALAWAVSRWEGQEGRCAVRDGVLDGRCIRSSLEWGDRAPLKQGCCVIRGMRLGGQEGRQGCFKHSQALPLHRPLPYIDAGSSRRGYWRSLATRQMQAVRTGPPRAAAAAFYSPETPSPCANP